MGKSSINGPFSMAMLNNQRVMILDIYNGNQIFPWTSPIDGHPKAWDLG